jgi:hypothetical protein
MNLRERVEQDLAITLEGKFKLPVELVDPEGVEYTKSANDPTSDLVGRVVYDRLIENPDHGGPMVVDKVHVTLRRSSLTRVPVAGETWAVRVPETPHVDADKETFLMEDPPEGGRSIGYIQLHLMKAAQS